MKKIFALILLCSISTSVNAEAFRNNGIAVNTRNNEDSVINITPDMENDETSAPLLPPTPAPSPETQNNNTPIEENSLSRAAELSPAFDMQPSNIKASPQQELVAKPPQDAITYTKKQIKKLRKNILTLQNRVAHLEAEVIKLKAINEDVDRETEGDENV